MNHPRTLYKWQIGHRDRGNYDAVLKRLKCFDSGDCRRVSRIIAPTFACKFCRVSNHRHLVALADEDGRITIHNTKLKCNGTLEEGKQAHNNAIFDIAWVDEEFKLVSVSGDHTAVLWDVSSSEMKEIGKFDAHIRSVKTVEFRPSDKAVFATGGRDGVVMLWDVRSARGSSSCKPDNYIANSHHIPGLPPGSSSRCKKSKCPLPSRANSVTGLIFQDENTLISCGAGDGLIKVWDLRKNYSAYKRDPVPKFQLQYSGNTSINGFTNLLLDPGHVKLYASCMDNTIYCYNVSTYEKEPVATYTGHEVGSFYVKTCLSPDGQYLLSGSSNEKAYIWNVDRPGDPVIALVGHYLEVTCVGWCPVGDMQVVTCSDDSNVRFWEIASEYEQNNENEIRGWAEDLGSSAQPLTLKLSGSKKFRTSSFSPSKVRAVLETTPKSQKRFTSCHKQKPETQVTSVSDLQLLQSCSYSQASCTKSAFEKGHCTENHSLKKCLEDCVVYNGQSGRKRPAFSPVKEENGELYKRTCYDSKGPRRLFSPVHKVVSSNKEDCITHNTDNFCCNVTAILASPTQNLPNYVIDGTSPHHSCTRSPSQKENVDWLTKLKSQKGSTEKPSQGTNYIPKRRSRSGSSSDGSILKFFRISGKSSEQTIYSTFPMTSGDCIK